MDHETHAPASQRPSYDVFAWVPEGGAPYGGRYQFAYRTTIRPFGIPIDRGAKYGLLWTDDGRGGALPFYAWGSEPL